MLERRHERRHRQDWRIAELPAFRTLDRVELRSHQKPRRLVVTPPAGKPRQLAAVRVTSVHVGAADGAGTCIYVLVVAPHGEIRAAVMQGDLDVADRVRKVEADEAALRVPGPRDRREVETLSGQVLHARQQDRRDARAVTLDRADDVLCPKQCLARAGCELDQVARGIAAVEAHLRFGRVAIRRKGALLDQERAALPGRAIEACEHEVQVDRERVHRHDFLRACTDQSRERRRGTLVIRHPRPSPGEVSLDRKRAPVLHALRHVALSELWLDAQRVPAQVEERRAVLTLRYLEARPPVVQRIGGVECLRVPTVEFHRRTSVAARTTGRLGAASLAKGAICSSRRYRPSSIRSGTYASSVTSAVARLASAVRRPPAGNPQYARCAARPGSSPRSRLGTSTTRLVTPWLTIQPMPSGRNQGARAGPS